MASTHLWQSLACTSSGFCSISSHIWFLGFLGTLQHKHTSYLTDPFKVPRSFLVFFFPPFLLWNAFHAYPIQTQWRNPLWNIPAELLTTQFNRKYPKGSMVQDLNARALGSERLGFTFCLCPIPSVCHWASYASTLRLDFIINKVRVFIIVLPQEWLRLNDLRIYHVREMAVKEYELLVWTIVSSGSLPYSMII